MRDARLSSVARPSGEPATGPIAVCEAQGYADDALHDAARLARDIWVDPTYADQLDTVATGLQARFIADFWCDDTKISSARSRRRPPFRAVPTITSNPGHLL